MYRKKANRRERSAGEAVSGVINGRKEPGNWGKLTDHLLIYVLPVPMWVKVTLKLKRAATGHAPHGQRDTSFADSLSESLLSAAQCTLSDSLNAPDSAGTTVAPSH